MSQDTTTEGISEIELSTRSTTNTPTFLETPVLNASLKALGEHLVNNPVRQSIFDRGLLCGILSVQRKKREPSQVAAALTILLQSGAKWNSDALLEVQKTPCHIHHESPGDYHELLDWMIISSHRNIFDIQDVYKSTTMLYAMQKANGNCFKCLIAHGVCVSIFSENLKIIAQYIRSGIDINYRMHDRIHGMILLFEASVLRGHHNIAKVLLIAGCSRGRFSLSNNHSSKDNLKPEVEKLMKEWKVQENNVTPLKQRCRIMILKHLYPRADVKVEKLPLPPLLIKFLNIPEFDVFVDL